MEDRINNHKGYFDIDHTEIDIFLVNSTGEVITGPIRISIKIDKNTRLVMEFEVEQDVTDTQEF